MKTPTITELLDDPVRFAQALGFELMPWQMDALRALAAPSIDGTATAFTPETLRRGIEAMKAGDAKRRAMPFPASETGEPVTSYTVMDDARAAESGKQVLVTADDIRMILNQMLRVGQISSRQGDGSRPYAVFNKRDCAIKIAQVVNDRFNARRAT